MQEHSDFSKRPNMRIMDTKEGEEVPAKSINDILNKIIAENSPNLEKEMPIQVQEASRTPTDMTKIEPLHGILSLKQLAQRTRKEY
jgi:hypothetical protein